MAPNNTYPGISIYAAEAMWWFNLAKRMLRERDWVGCRSCAIRARDIDRRMSRAVDEIVAICDTLHAGERRTLTNQPDWYAILGLTPFQGRNRNLISDRYHNLVYILNPHRNRFPFADRAIAMVSDAWAILSDPMRKRMYDSDLGFYPPQQFTPPVNDPLQAMHNYYRIYGPPQPVPLHVGVPVHAQQRPVVGVPAPQAPQPQAPQPQPQTIMSFSSNGGSGSADYKIDHMSWAELINALGSENSSSTSSSSTENQNQSNAGNAAAVGETFWTVCPYCFFVYQYPDRFANRAMFCQKCRKVFQAMVMTGTPPIVDGQEAYYFNWGSMPFGPSDDNRNGAGPSNAPADHVGGSSSNPMENNVNYKELVEILDSTDDESDVDDAAGDLREKSPPLLGEEGEAANANAVVDQLAAGFDLDTSVLNEFQGPAAGTNPVDEIDESLFEGLDEILVIFQS